MTDEDERGMTDEDECGMTDEDERGMTDEDERDREAFWNSVIATPIGRKFIWEFLAMDCHFEETRFSVGPNGFPQSESTWFEAGRQDIGQRLAKSLQKRCRDLYLVMLDENDPAFARPRKREVKNG